jgi:hypothetical protein
MQQMKRKKGNRAKGTCEWFLGTEEFTCWLNHEQIRGAGPRQSGILWLHGLSGAEKSIMSVFLAEEVLKIFVTTVGKSLSYFFCDSGFEQRRSAAGILRGLLLQLLQQHPELLNYIMPKYDERGSKLFSSFDALWSLLMSMASDKATGRKYCIVDALDECD